MCSNKRNLAYWSDNTLRQTLWKGTIGLRMTDNKGAVGETRFRDRG